jgi:hypothetical protein
MMQKIKLFFWSVFFLLLFSEQKLQAQISPPSGWGDFTNLNGNELESNGSAGDNGWVFARLQAFDVNRPYLGSGVGPTVNITSPATGSTFTSGPMRGYLREVVLRAVRKMKMMKCNLKLIT